MFSRKTDKFTDIHTPYAWDLDVMLQEWLDAVL